MGRRGWDRAELRAGRLALEAARVWNKGRARDKAQCSRPAATEATPALGLDAPATARSTSSLLASPT